MTLTNDRGLLTGSRKCGEVACLGVRLHEVAAVRKEVRERCLRGEWERERGSGPCILTAVGHFCRLLLSAIDLEKRGGRGGRRGQ